MKIYDVVQWLIILGAVLFSALYMLGRIAPQWRLQLSKHLQQPSYARWINNVGVRLGGTAGCGSGCDTCGACEAPKTSNKK